MPDEEERATMRRIVEWQDGGLSFNNISNVLIKQKVFWKKPSKKERRGYTLELWDRQRCRRAYAEMGRITQISVY